MKQLFALLGLTLLLVSTGCDSNVEKEKALEGNWTSYSIARGGESVNQTAEFSFKEGNYTYDIGSHHEEGEYWVQGDKLYTEGPKVMKKKVQISKLENDTLILKMNDKGVPMSMAFVKE